MTLFFYALVYCPDRAWLLRIDVQVRDSEDGEVRRSPQARFRAFALGAPKTETRNRPFRDVSPCYLRKRVKQAISLDLAAAGKKTFQFCFQSSRFHLDVLFPL